MKARLISLEELKKRYPNWRRTSTKGSILIDTKDSFGKQVDWVISDLMLSCFDGITEHEFKEISNGRYSCYTHIGPGGCAYHSDWFMSIAEEIFAEIEENFLKE